MAVALKKLQKGGADGIDALHVVGRVVSKEG
jgi:hypothetical protein